MLKIKKKFSFMTRCALIKITLFLKNEFKSNLFFIIRNLSLSLLLKSNRIL